MSGALDFWPKKNRSGVSLPSWELPHIYRDPPRAIFTRKKERVEMGDVSYNIREDDSRINDAIMNYPKGVNPMVGVDYQNRQQQLTTMTQTAASNPYKVNASFRPPMFKQEDLLPLSRQKHPPTTVTTNPGFGESGGGCDLSIQYDHQDTRFATDVFKPSQPFTSQLSSMFGIQTRDDEGHWDRNAINEMVLRIQDFVTNPSLQNEENRPELRAQDMKIKDYFHDPLMAVASRNIQFTVDSKHKELKNNIPAHSVTPNLSDPYNNVLMTNIEKLSEIKDNTTYQIVGTNPSNQMQIPIINDEIKLNKRTHYFDTSESTNPTNGFNARREVHQQHFTPQLRMKENKLLRGVANYNNRV